MPPTPLCPARRVSCLAFRRLMWGLDWNTRRVRGKTLASSWVRQARCMTMGLRATPHDWRMSLLSSPCRSRTESATSSKQSQTSSKGLKHSLSEARTTLSPTRLRTQPSSFREGPTMAITHAVCKLGGWLYDSSREHALPFEAEADKMRSLNLTVRSVDSDTTTYNGVMQIAKRFSGVRIVPSEKLLTALGKRKSRE